MLAQLGGLAVKCAAWPPRPMPVWQPWVESVLASGGYGSHSIQRHLLLLATRWATCTPAAAAAADTAAYGSSRRTQTCYAALFSCARAVWFVGSMYMRPDLVRQM